MEIGAVERVHGSTQTCRHAAQAQAGAHAGAARMDLSHGPHTMHGPTVHEDLHGSDGRFF